MRTTIVWLYIFLFIAFFDLHAQYPILTPFALSLGATPAFIGIIMGMYSLTHLPGNILAGIGVDRHGSKQFIVYSLIVAGLILIVQAYATDPWHLLIVRSISGFVLAFLSPACLALLAKLARDRTHQGKLMSGNGLIHTLASVVSPAAGALLVAKIGFTISFVILGIVLIFAGLLALFGIVEPNLRDMAIKPSATLQASTSTPWLFYLFPMALSCSQGILFFELPLMDVAKASIMTSGLLFSIVSLGALITLSMLFINRWAPFLRIATGGAVLTLTFFGMAINWTVPLTISLLLIGMAKGIIFPAVASMLALITDVSRYGRIFAILSIAFSLGSFIGPILSGQFRNMISPYFIAFLGLMIAIICLPFSNKQGPEPTGALNRS